MFNNEYKTIGMFICGVTGTFEKSLCVEMTKNARKNGYNLAIFNGFRDYTYRENKGYTAGETNIVNLPPYDELAGVIIVPDTFVAESFRNTLISTVREKAKCPIISIRTELQGYHNIIIDNRTALESMIGHFIEKHNMTKLAFLSGPKNHPDAIQRLECFINTMNKYQLPVRQDWIVNGTFWMDKAPEIIDHYLSGDKSEWPQAIICANDYMAISLCDECLERGIRVPEDVAISGFDNLPECMSCYPPLTTVEASAEDISDECMRVIMTEKDNSNTRTHYIDTRDVYRSSCGCHDVNIKSVLGCVRATRNDNETLFRAARGNTYMSMQLQNLERYEDLGKFLYSDYNNFKEVYICLCLRNTKRGLIVSPKSKGYPKKMYCVYGLRNDQILPIVNFNTEELVPQIEASDEPVQYYFTPLHFHNNNFGYVAHTYDEGRCYDRAFQNWMTVIGNAIENIRTKQRYSELVDELNNQYLHESMTGLYNRRGFDNLSHEMYERAVNEGKRMMLIEIDMDNLKRVNDMYGHSEGDKAIDIIAEALKSVEEDTVICSRVGGDEFWIIAYDYTRVMMDNYIAQLKQALEELDRKEQKPYTVEVSFGAVLTDPESGLTLEEYINIVDSRMYKNKRERKKKQGNFEV